MFDPVQSVLVDANVWYSRTRWTTVIADATPAMPTCTQPQWPAAQTQLDGSGTDYLLTLNTKDFE